MNEVPNEPTMVNELGEVSGSPHSENSMETREYHEVIEAPEAVSTDTKQEEGSHTFDDHRKTKDKEMIEENESIKVEGMLEEHNDDTFTPVELTGENDEITSVEKTETQVLESSAVVGASMKYERMHTLYMAESFESKEVVVCVANDVPIEVTELSKIDEEKDWNETCKSEQLSEINVSNEAIVLTEASEETNSISADKKNVIAHNEALFVTGIGLVAQKETFVQHEKNEVDIKNFWEETKEAPETTKRIEEYRISDKVKDEESGTNKPDEEKRFTEEKEVAKASQAAETKEKIDLNKGKDKTESEKLTKVNVSPKLSENDVETVAKEETQIRKLAKEFAESMKENIALEATDTKKATDTNEAIESTDTNEAIESTDTKKATDTNEEIESTAEIEATTATETTKSTEDTKAIEVNEATESAATIKENKAATAVRLEVAEVTEESKSTKVIETADLNEATEDLEAAEENTATEAAALTEANKDVEATEKVEANEATTKTESATTTEETKIAAVGAIEPATEVISTVAGKTTEITALNEATEEATPTTSTETVPNEATKSVATPEETKLAAGGAKEPAIEVTSALAATATELTALTEATEAAIPTTATETVPNEAAESFATTEETKLAAADAMYPGTETAKAIDVINPTKISEAVVLTEAIAANEATESTATTEEIKIVVGAIKTATEAHKATDASKVIREAGQTEATETVPNEAAESVATTEVIKLAAGAIEPATEENQATEISKVTEAAATTEETKLAGEVMEATVPTEATEVTEEVKATKDTEATEAIDPNEPDKLTETKNAIDLSNISISKEEASKTTDNFDVPDVEGENHFCQSIDANETISSTDNSETTNGTEVTESTDVCKAVLHKKGARFSGEIQNWRRPKSNLGKKKRPGQPRKSKKEVDRFFGALIQIYAILFD